MQDPTRAPAAAPTRDPRVDRRTVLRGVAGATGAALAGGAGAATAGSASAASTDLAGWFENTGNYDGVVDATGESEVTVEVGANGNNAPGFAFGPAAIRVDPGTTVTWEWTGQGGQHNVVASDGSFESDLTGSQGHTFEHTFEEAGVTRYYCRPHETIGMKGAVVVGDAAVGGSGGGLSASPELLALGGALLAGLLSPLGLAALMARNGDRETDQVSDAPGHRPG